MDVSILIATFRSAKTLAGSIESVLGQTDINLELLIADGASTDGTVEICKKYEKSISYFVTESDAGVYDAWNKLLPHARGEWICFIGSDDQFWAPDTLKRLVDAAAARPVGCRLVYGQVHYFDEQGTNVFSEGRDWAECRAEMRTRNSIPHIATLHHRSIFDEGTKFDPRFKIAGDYNLIRREALAHGAFFVADVKSARAGWGGLSTRPELELTSIREVGQVIRDQDGIFPPLVWWVRLVKVSLRRTIHGVFGQAGLNNYERLKSLLGKGRSGWSPKG